MLLSKITVKLIRLGKFLNDESESNINANTFINKNFDESNTNIHPAFNKLDYLISEIENDV